jgi:hypothetical protein
VSTWKSRSAARAASSWGHRKAPKKRLVLPANDSARGSSSSACTLPAATGAVTASPVSGAAIETESVPNRPDSDVVTSAGPVSTRSRLPIAVEDTLRSASSSMKPRPAGSWRRVFSSTSPVVDSSVKRSPPSKASAFHIAVAGSTGNASVAAARNRRNAWSLPLLASSR